MAFCTSAATRTAASGAFGPGARSAFAIRALGGKSFTQVKGGAVPYLTVDGAIKAAEFYKKAFGAEVAALHPADEKGRTMHVHLYINGSSVM
jgi:hypothetical protein